MHGCGNDYIYFDNLNKTSIDPSFVKDALWVCDRHKGIGGDGLVFILSSDIADAKMSMFNADGSEGAMCGNAIRCVAKYLYDNVKSKAQITIETKSGVKAMNIIAEGGVATHVMVDMGAAILDPTKTNLEVEGKHYAITCVSMGNPHAVIFMDDIDKLDLTHIGPKFEHHPLFPDRTNTEFVRVIAPNHLAMRVWERGSGETQACGTGACAAAVAAVLNGHCDKNTDIRVDLLGGTLTIKYTDDTVYMTGEAVVVYKGEVHI